MLKRCMCLILLMMLTLSITASADITSKDISKALRKNLTHPYLYFTEKEKPAILAKIKNDPVSRDIMDLYIAEANRDLHTPVETPLPRQLRDSRFNTSGKF